MPIRITEIRNPNLNAGRAERASGAVISSSDEAKAFKVEGTLHLKDAELLERICRQVFAKTGMPVLINFNDLCFVNSDSAAVICQMKRENLVIIEGVNLFIKQVMKLVDASDCCGAKRS